MSKNISSLPEGERDGRVREERWEDVISFHIIFDSRQSALEQDVLSFYPSLPPSRVGWYRRGQSTLWACVCYFLCCWWESYCFISY